MHTNTQLASRPLQSPPPPKERFTTHSHAYIHLMTFKKNPPLEIKPNPHPRNYLQNENPSDQPTSQEKPSRSPSPFPRGSLNILLDRHSSTSKHYTSKHHSRTHRTRTHAYFAPNKHRLKPELKNQNQNQNQNQKRSSEISVHRRWRVECTLPYQ